MKNYSELIRLETFEERFNYLKTVSKVGIATFGHQRYLNQRFYNSDAWKSLRYQILSRDNARDLGIVDLGPNFDSFTIHHINPITIDDVLNNAPKVWDPENLITTTSYTHKALHYGSANPYNPFGVAQNLDGSTSRSPGDTMLWGKLDKKYF